MTPSDPFNNYTLPPLAREFEAADFRDSRLTARLQTMAESAGRAPAEWFPTQACSDAAREGTYRFLNNSKVSPAAILAPHIEMTCQRSEAAGKVLVIHDTSIFDFKGESVRTGLGPLAGTKRGFFAHFALAVTSDGRRRPLGVVGLHTFVRNDTPKGKRRLKERQQDPERESLRWESLALDVGKRLASRADVIHVMDREADAYETFAGLQASGQKFVIRLSHDRSILSNGSEPEFAKIFAALESAEPIVEREVPISRRPKRKQSPRADRLHPPREGRLARLKIA